MVARKAVDADLNETAPVSTQNVFTIIVEHYEDVEDMSRQTRDIVAALPGVIRCGILLPSFPERDIVMNDGTNALKRIMP